MPAFVSGTYAARGSLAIEPGPASLIYPLVHDLAPDVLRHVRPLQLDPEDLLDLRVGEGHAVLGQGEGVHVCAQVRVGHRWVRSGQHRRPRADVRVVDLFHDFLETELERFASYISNGKKRTAANAAYPGNGIRDEVVIFKRRPEQARHCLARLVQRRLVVVDLQNDVSEGLQTRGIKLLTRLNRGAMTLTSAGGMP